MSIEWPVWCRVHLCVRSRLSGVLGVVFMMCTTSIEWRFGCRVHLCVRSRLSGLLSVVFTDVYDVD